MISQTGISPRKAFSRTGIALTVMILASQFAYVFLDVLFGELVPYFQQRSYYVLILNGVSMYLIGFPLFLLIMRRIPGYKNGEEKKLSLTEFWRLLMVSLGATYIFNIVGGIVNGIISALLGREVVNPLESLIMGMDLVWIMGFVVILGPIVEELIFRGVLISKTRAFGEKRSVLFSALTFALFHGNFSQFFYAFALGMIFAYVAVKTNTLKYSIALHMIINFFGSVLIPRLALSDNSVLVFAAAAIIIALLAGGVAIFVKNRKEMVLESSGDDLKVAISRSDVYFNFGMMVYCMICAVMFVSALMYV